MSLSTFNTKSARRANWSRHRGRKQGTARNCRSWIDIKRHLHSDSTAVYQTRHPEMICRHALHDGWVQSCRLCVAGFSAGTQGARTHLKVSGYVSSLFAWQRHWAMADRLIELHYYSFGALN